MVDVGVPGPGAGVIGSPGATDVYTFEALAGLHVGISLFSDESELCIGGLSWSVVGPTGDTVALQPVEPDTCTSTVEDLPLPDGGEYQIMVFSTSDAVGEYGLTLENIPVEDKFVIEVGDAVSEDVPSPGAGRIDLPGERDVYLFAASAGKGVNFFSNTGDFLPCEPEFFWQLTGPGGDIVFDTGLASSYCGQQIGSIKLDQAGPYTLTVWAGKGVYGGYSFILAHATIFP